MQKLRITMKKHPSCFKVLEPLASINAAAVSDRETVLFDGTGTFEIL